MEVKPDVATVFAHSVEEFQSRVREVGEDAWDRPTPCTDWDVRALVNHVVGEQRWVVPLLEGKTIAEVGDALDGDLLGSAPLEAADAAAKAAVSAFVRARRHGPDRPPLLRGHPGRRVRLAADRRPRRPRLGPRGRGGGRSASRPGPRRPRRALVAAVGGGLPQCGGGRPARRADRAPVAAGPADQLLRSRPRVVDVAGRRRPVRRRLGGLGPRPHRRAASPTTQSSSRPVRPRTASGSGQGGDPRSVAADVRRDPGRRRSPSRTRPSAATGRPADGSSPGPTATGREGTSAAST